MLSPQNALQIVLDNALTLGTESLPLRATIGRTLAEDIVADRDFPPFNRVAMDGIAIAFQEDRTQWEVEGRQYAGEAQKKLADSQNCLEVMTGAVLPEGTDTVIRYEDFTIEEENGIKKAVLSIDYQGIKLKQNVHHQGVDRVGGEMLIEVGTAISPTEMAVMASVGKTMVQVLQMPSLAIISTGDELVDIDENPLPHQIRRSNSYMLAGALQERYIQPNLFHLLDDKELLFNKIQEIMATHEVIILNGGVSEGKADFVPEILEKLGVVKLFHKVNQRPGKPFWFGKSPEGKLVFALPGNPVSTFVCLYKYVLAGIFGKTTTEKVVLSQKIVFEPKLTYFVPTKTYRTDEGVVMAKPFLGSGSADFANLLACDGFIELPAEPSIFEEGAVFEMIRFR